MVEAGSLQFCFWLRVGSPLLLTHPCLNAEFSTYGGYYQSCMTLLYGGIITPQLCDSEGHSRIFGFNHKPKLAEKGQSASSQKVVSQNKGTPV